MSQTQFDRVLAALFAKDEVCGSELYGMYIPRFGSHIHRARRAGYVITKRPCDRHEWHEGTAWLYRLEATPSQPKEKAGSLDGETGLNLVSNRPQPIDRVSAFIHERNQP